MEKKNILIIIAIAIILAVSGIIAASFLMNSNIEYTTLRLSDTCALSVPLSNNSTFAEEDGMKTYNDTGLRIMHYNKNDLNAWENLGADIGVNAGLNQNFKYNNTYHGVNILIHPEENKTVLGCLITNNTTGDVIIIMSDDEAILYHIIDSVNFTSNNATNITKNASDSDTKSSGSSIKSTNNKTTDGDEYVEGYIAENDVDIDVDGDGVGDGSAYHSHEYYVERGQTEPIPLGGG